MMELCYVHEFRESSSESDDDSSEPIPKRRKGLPREWSWSKVREFESRDEAEMYVKAKQTWSKSSTKTLVEGHRVEYRCIGGKYRTHECPAGLYLLYHSTNMKVTLFETVCGHDNHDTSPQRGLPLEMKNFVKEKFEEGIQKPNAILAAIRRKQMVEPPKSKLITYVKRLRQEKYGQPNVSAGEIDVWCSERTRIPSEEDEPFVLDYLVRAESADVDEQDLKIVISTKRLLRNLTKSAMVQIDTTYKLIWQGYPVMILGTSDKNQVFHPFGLAVCKDEATEDFAFIFQAFHKFDPVLFVNTKTLRAECSCPYFLEHLICKHSLGMLIRLKLMDTPAAAKCVPLGQKRKRGRPSKARKALLTQ